MDKKQRHIYGARTYVLPQIAALEFESEIVALSAGTNPFEGNDEGWEDDYGTRRFRYDGFGGSDWE